MASALYLENFLESIETLPLELQRNFTLMGDLDQRTQDLLAEIDSNSQDYKSNVKKLEKEERKDKLSKIQELFQKAREYSDDKVQIAMQMYEMVDKHIRRLDSDLSRFEQELQMKEPGVRPGSVSSVSDLPTPTLSKSRKRAATSTSLDSGSSRKRSTYPPQVMSQDVLDMPVDPNEPTYCLCHQVSFGEMVGCDNQECPIEWFHFQCVGLSSQPKGKWYCPICSQEKEKNKKKF